MRLDSILRLNDDFLMTFFNRMAVCLDSLGFGDDIYMHVSKPPKEGTTSHNFLANLKVR